MPTIPRRSLPVELDEGENLSSSLVANGGSIVSETSMEIDRRVLTEILQGLLTPKSTGTAFERRAKRFGARC